MPDHSKRFTESAREAAEKIKPILAHLGPEVQGAVLGDLFAMFLAGHVGEGADELREEIIEQWLILVRDLLPIYQARLEKIKKNRQKKLRKIRE